jgi:hypothetical protein
MEDPPHRSAEPEGPCQFSKQPAERGKICIGKLCQQTQRWILWHNLTSTPALCAVLHGNQSLMSTAAAGDLTTSLIMTAEAEAAVVAQE